MFRGVVGIAKRALSYAGWELSRVDAPREADQVRDILGRSLVGIFRSTWQGRLVEANPAFLRALGFESIEHVNRVGLPSLYVERGDRGRLVSALREGPVSGFRAPFRRADGRVITGHLSAHLIADEAGEPAFLDGTFEDVTERIAAEAAVRESERRLAQIIDFLPDATLVIDREGKVVLWNRALSEMTGVPAKDMIGKGDHEYALPFYGERRPILIDLALARHEDAEKNYANLERQGSVLVGEAYTPNLRGAHDVYLYATASALVDSQGRVSGAIECIRDTTDRKRAELELRAAREAADAASRAKSTFLASMSHELRTPLNAIIGYSEMLAEDAEDEGAAARAADLMKIQATGKHLLGVINDILDFSKIEAGKLDLAIEEFDLAELVRDVASTVEALVEKKANRLEIAVEPDLGAMRSDPLRVRQCLFNLLSNAAKFTERGVIGLSARRLRDGARDMVELRVSDSGIGMSPDQIARLFQPFTQAEASTSRRYGGTGLGLVITRRFCQLMGGEVTASSAVGEGSTFTMTLPADAKTSTRGADETSGEERPARSAPTRRPILVIDSDADARALLEGALSAEGFHVVGAATSDEGLRLARAIRPAVITVDVLMPEMDGWAVLTALKADAKTASIPVVMVSVSADHHVGHALGAADFLHKPIERDRLVEVLSRYVEGPGPTILVVDDDPTTREMMRRMVEREGFHVVEAENGKVALERIAERPPELVLLDLMMPEMDGFEFVARLRRDERWRSLPIVVVTAKDLTREDREALEGSVNASYQKGAGHAALLSEVRALVSRTTGAG